ncbi:MAG TPA: HlyD family efflux transporter periplasmic adaptor subunit [Geminicoccus sp.]|jgi:HlyD family secretion protein|uniref:HlyD family secretion protein n=1 Tax=Geminicoccus sp. TaxID=2024832 RepID=UPI002E334DAB|nr:HlyD family efflux transporter periplasmic adaptor subunit [Geminicoccus sp.]HEX2526715.1 HlyD family efflux transporter periplasmic adaptor subunit [Geminicoccus sp.]
MLSRRSVVVLVVLLAIVGGGFLWWRNQAPELPPGIARGNGRIEAEPIDIASKYAGRVLELRVEEGDRVEAGQVVAVLESTETEEMLREAEADLRRYTLQRSETLALLSSRQSELALAQIEFDRASELRRAQNISQAVLDQRRVARDAAAASVEAAKAAVGQIEAAIEGGEAAVARTQAMLDELTLHAPRAGRVQYRLVQTGTVVAAGQRVYTLLDVTDVHMTIFLPTADAGRLAIGSEARIVLDAAPTYRIPAQVSFVASEAQFTPRFVETQDERNKLMFRVKVRLPRELLAKFADYVKTGVTGVAYVLVDREATWPADLELRLPDEP